MCTFTSAAEKGRHDTAFRGRRGEADFMALCFGRTGALATTFWSREPRTTPGALVAAMWNGSSAQSDDSNSWRGRRGSTADVVADGRWWRTGAVSGDTRPCGASGT
eukprot:4427070-Prymnesium_polylepis.3